MLHTETSILNVHFNGNDSGETIIFLHGGPGVPDYLTDVSGKLIDSCRTVTFDQRGTGKSECLNEDFGIDEYISDLDKIIELSGVDKVHLFGHSWGGLLAQLYAARNREKIHSLFLCSPSSGVGGVWKRMEKEVMAYNKRKSSRSEWLYIGINSLLGLAGSDKAYRNIFKNIWKFYFEDPSKAPEADESWLLGIKAKAVNDTRKNIVSFECSLLDKGLVGIDFPVTVLFGEYDIYGESSELIKERLPNANYIILEGSGHLPWIQSKDRFLSILYDHYSLS